jgi:hypothetical protein
MVVRPAAAQGRGFGIVMVEDDLVWYARGRITITVCGVWRTKREAALGVGVASGGKDGVE